MTRWPTSPGVKLRLSKARPNRKEGVEAEIRKDLTALARNRAISDVIIVSAEEDLAPVIAEVQDLGIRTILLHIAADGDWAVSRTLRQECDDIIEISAGHLRPYVDLISGAEPQLGAGGYRELGPGPRRLAVRIRRSRPLPPDCTGRRWQPSTTGPSGNWSAWPLPDRTSASKGRARMRHALPRRRAMAVSPPTAWAWDMAGARATSSRRALSR